MTDPNHYEVIIIGGSYSGLSAAMSLGRALKRVLIIDSGQPCNRQTPHSHNFLTRDGETPARLAEIARAQVAAYESISFFNGIALSSGRVPVGFEIYTRSGERFTAKKLIFSTGLSDQMPGIKGFAECWGISIIHCPYCHGYEVRQEVTGIIGNGDVGFEYAKLINNWTKSLTVFTNGPAAFSAEQQQKLQRHEIKVMETPIGHVEHEHGHIRHLVMQDGSKHALKALFSRPAFVQQCGLPAQLGCEFTEQGFIKVDAFQKTSVEGIFASGDNSSMARSVSNAVATGTMAGVFCSKELMEEVF